MQAEGCMQLDAGRASALVASADRGVKRGLGLRRDRVKDVVELVPTPNPDARGWTLAAAAGISLARTML